MDEAVAFDVGLDRDFAGAAAVVSITDCLVFSGEMGAGVLALLVFSDFDFLTDSTTGLLATGADFFALPASDFPATAGLIEDFAKAGVFFALAATAGFFDTTAFFATGFDLAATGLPAAGLALAFAFVAAALDTAFALGFAAGFALAATLVDLAVDLVFFMIFAISFLTE